MASTPPQPRFEDTPDGLLVRAPAKVNLNLLVGPRRADGFHDLDSLVVKISLVDDLLLSRPDPARHAGETPLSRRDTVALSCEGADCGLAEHNLVYRAARLLQTHAHEHGWAKPDDDLGVHIHLIKRTPPGKGLGGGSSDAAAALLGLCRFWNLEHATAAPVDTLLSLAARLGSDVPLFLTTAACRIQGRGERFEPFDIGPLAMVLFLPDLFCATPEVYRAFDQRPTVDTRPLTERQLDAATLRLPTSRWRDRLTNDLLLPARRVCPALGYLHGLLQSHTDVPIHMTGSGSALFAPCDNTVEASYILHTLPQDLRNLGIIVQTVSM